MKTDHIQDISTGNAKSVLKNALVLILLFFAGGKAFGQLPPANTTCATAAPFCGSNAYTFPAGVCPIPGTCEAEPGPCYDCLATTPNPAWYYMMIGTSGDIIISITENPYQDVDFICWGPFTSPTGECVAGLTCLMVVDCSYSASGNETCTILNAQAGEFYLLLLTNYSNNPTNITFQQTNYGQPGAGTTDCNIVINCSMSAISPVPSACDPFTNTFSITGSLEFSNPPATGTLTVTDVTAIPPVTQTFLPPFNSPQPFSLAGISCDGLVHSVTATFSDSTNCNLTQTCTAPPPSCPVATIGGGGDVCADGSTVAVIISFPQGAPPFDFAYAIDGVPEPPVLNYNGPFPYVINTNIPGLYTLVSVSNAFCPGTVSGSATVNLIPLPVPSLSGNNNVCIGATNEVYNTDPEIGRAHV